MCSVCLVFDFFFEAVTKGVCVASSWPRRHRGAGRGTPPRRGCCSATTLRWWGTRAPMRRRTRAHARAAVLPLLLRAGFSPWRARRQELLAWTFAALGCGWPEPPGAGAQRGRFTRVAVLADPQLTDRTSYRTAASGPLLVVRLRVRA